MGICPAVDFALETAWLSSFSSDHITYGQLQTSLSLLFAHLYLFESGTTVLVLVRWLSFSSVPTGVLLAVTFRLAVAGSKQLLIN